nr:putative reverse transcriptase domain-containing protein [Tanacetum cinerariifolium]
MDEPMENLVFDEEEELNEFMDDDRDVGNEEVIDELCVRMSNLEYRYKELVKKMEIVSDVDPSSSDYFGGTCTDPEDLIAWNLVIEPVKELNIRQRRWIELLSNYECEIKYHSGKENVVADALSRKERLKPRRVRAMSITIHFGLKTKILEAQGKASKDLKALAEWLRGLETHFERQDDGGIYFFDRI